MRLYIEVLTKKKKTPINQTAKLLPSHCDGVHQNDTIVKGLGELSTPIERIIRGVVKSDTL